MIGYKEEDIQRAVMLLNNVKVTGIESCQSVAEIAHALQNTGTLIRDGEKDNGTGDTTI